MLNFDVEIDNGLSSDQLFAVHNIAVLVLDLKVRHPVSNL